MTNWWDQTLEERIEDYKNELSKPPRGCNDCGVEPNSFHEPGCDIARCSLCGYQAISCGCNTTEEWDDDLDDYVYTKVDLDWDETTLPWEGYWPNIRECVEYGLDLNGINRLRWDQEQKKFVKHW